LQEREHSKHKARSICSGLHSLEKFRRKENIVGRGLAPAVFRFLQDFFRRSKPLPYGMTDRFPIPGKVDFA